MEDFDNKKEKHSKRYRRNMIAKSLRDPDLRGPFSMKVVDGRKSEYKRQRININKIKEEFEDDE